MESSVSSTRGPLIISLLFVVAGVVIAAIGGLSAGSLWGGAVAAIGIIPACVAAWGGMQKKTQGSLGLALLMVLVSLGAASILVILRVIDWMR